MEELDQTGPIRGIQGAPAEKADPRTAKTPIPGGSTRRKTLSDITNLTAGDRESPKPASCSGTEEFIDQLINENSALLRLLEERNKIIESSGVELQKLRLALQKAHQQNWHLAQASSRMIAELHLGKDRLKELQHELGCAAAVLRAKKFELQEAKRLHRQPENKISIEVEEEISKPIRRVSDASRPTNHKKDRNPSEKRMLRSLSSGSSVPTRKTKEKEKDGDLRRRSSLRRRSGNGKVEQSEPTDDLFEIEDLKLPIRSMCAADVREDNSSEANGVNPANEETGEEGCSNERADSSVVEIVSSSSKEAPTNTKTRRDE